MSEQNDNLEQFDDVLDRLNDLRSAFAQERYPGRAWPVRRRRSLRLILWPAVGVAAAAAILIAVLAWPHLVGSPAPTDNGQIANVIPTPHPSPKAAPEPAISAAEFDLMVLELLTDDSADRVSTQQTTTEEWLFGDPYGTLLQG